MGGLDRAHVVGRQAGDRLPPAAARRGLRDAGGEPISQLGLTPVGTTRSLTAIGTVERSIYSEVRFTVLGRSGTLEVTTTKTVTNRLGDLLDLAYLRRWAAELTTGTIAVSIGAATGLTASSRCAVRHYPSGSQASRGCTWPTASNDSTQSRSDSSNGRNRTPVTARTRSLRRSLRAQIARSSASRALISAG